ncbi:MAG: hypothetical protein ACWGNV_16030, partial [Bacteroidales bacterium]
MKFIHKLWFVLLAVAITAALKFILMDWLHWRAFYIVGITLFWLGYIYYLEKDRREQKRNLTFSLDHFKKSLLLLSPFILLSITAILLYASQHQDLSFKWRMIPVLLLYPIWGII